MTVTLWLPALSACGRGLPRAAGTGYGRPVERSDGEQVEEAEAPVGPAAVEPGPGIEPLLRGDLWRSARSEPDGAELPGTPSSGFKVQVDRDRRLTLVLREVPDEDL
jgi:hypothetical protein